MEDNGPGILEQDFELEQNGGNSWSTTGTKPHIHENSPVDIVASTVNLNDYPNLPCLTLRFWIAGTLLSTIMPMLIQYSYFNIAKLTVDFAFVQILSFFVGKVLEFVLPDLTFKIFGTNFYISPGDFNHKEHMLVATAAYASCGTQMSVELFNKYYWFNKDFIESWDVPCVYWVLLVIGIQLLGYSYSGYLIKILVKPSAMVWPSTLVGVATSNALHKFNKPSLLKQKYLILTLASVGIAAYQLLPKLFLPVLSSVALLCYFNTSSNTLSNLSSAARGLGILNFSFDWTTVGRTQPLSTPFWASVNYYLGGVTIAWIAMPIVYYGLKFQDFPITSQNLYTDQKTTIQLSDILENPQEIDAIGAETIITSPYLALIYAADLAATTAIISHCTLYYFKFFKRSLLGTQKNKDVHVEMMKRYKPVPLYVFIMLFAFSLMVIAAVLSGDVFRLWPYLLFCSVTLSGLFVAFVGIIKAISNITINPSMFYLGVSLSSGSELSIMDAEVITAIGRIAIDRCLALLSSFKLALYLKVPFRAVLLSQIYGTLLGSVTSLSFAAYFNVQIKDFSNLPSSHRVIQDLSNFIRKSILLSNKQGPKMMITNDHIEVYFIFLLAGILLPIPFYLLHRRYPLQNWHLINIPILMFGAHQLSTYTNHIITGFIVAFTFQYVIYRYKHGFWVKFNYIIASALDIGRGLSSLIIILLVSAINVNISKFSLNTSNFEYCKA